MVLKILTSIFGLATALIGCTGIPKGLAPVTGFEPERYLGKWYEIARLDHSFERNLTNVSATYTRSENGDIRVLNRGFNTSTGEWKQIEGHARFLESDTVGSLKVSFFGPFYGGYHVIALDRKNYHYAMVAGPSLSYLWILARRQTLDPDLYADLVSKAGEWGFDITKLIKVVHNLPDPQAQPLKNHKILNSDKEEDIIKPCPKRPNCLSSVDADPGHSVRPIRFAGSVADARKCLLKIISDFKRARVVSLKDNFVQAEFVSSIFRFVDDVEFYFDDRRKIIHVKSASRVGYYDFGVNRRRIEDIRTRFSNGEKNAGNT